MQITFAAIQEDAQGLVSAFQKAFTLSRLSTKFNQEGTVHQPIFLEGRVQPTKFIAGQSGEYGFQARLLGAQVAVHDPVGRDLTERDCTRAQAHKVRFRQMLLSIIKVFVVIDAAQAVSINVFREMPRDVTAKVCTDFNRHVIQEDRKGLEEPIQMRIVEVGHGYQEDRM